MTERAITRCPHCDHEIRADDLLSRQGELEVYRCAACGRPVELMAVHEVPEAGSFRVTVTWPAGMSDVHVAGALRKLLPELRQRSLPDLRAFVGERTAVAIPELNESEANALVAEARRLGLDAERAREPDDPAFIDQEPDP
jgi:hypothetical protein